MPDPLDFFRIRPSKRTIKIVRKGGVLFSNPKGIKKVVFYVSNLIIVLSVLYLSYLYFPLGKAIIKYWEVTAENNNGSPVGLVDLTGTPVPTPTENPIDKNQYWIQIPKIQAKANIIANVSASDKGEYLKVLEKDDIAQAAGSYNPGAGKGKSVYLFAHSTQQGLSMVRNNAVFYLLGELKNGDVVFINFMGKIYSYKIYKQVIASADEVKYLSYSEADKEVLILQTCWPIGTDWRRLLVFGELTEN